MNILFVCKSLPPKVTGGIQTHVWKLSERLIELGHQVSILSAGKFRKPMVQKRVEGRIILELPYFPGRKIPVFGVFAEEWAFNVAAAKWLKRFGYRYDIIHVQGRSGFLFPALARQTPVVTTFHGILSVEHARSEAGVRNWATRLHERWATRMERKAILHSDRCIAVSQEMLRNMETVAPMPQRNVVILPNGVDLPGTMAKAGDTEQLLFVGRLEKIKGIYPLLAALEKMPPQITLKCIGDGSERENMQRIVREKGLQDRVVFTGALPSDMVFEALHQSFALILPSFHETQGIVLLEANAAGIPVVASNIPGITEVVEDGVNGLLATPGDAQGLAVAVQNLLDDPHRARLMGAKGRAIVCDRFSWQQIALETERIYGEMLAHSTKCLSKSSIPANSEVPMYINPFVSA